MARGRWHGRIGAVPRVLYRGGTGQKIRKYLVDDNYVDSVIQLPEDMLLGTTIAVCVLVSKKGKKDNDVLFIGLH